jgi:hypothetical protein
MKKLLFAILFLPSLGWASYQPVTGSTVTVSPYGGSMAVTGTFYQTTQPVSIANPSAGVYTVTNSTNPLLIQSTSTINVALAANQSVNVAQINAATPLMNNGASGTGSQRINIANDNTGIANWGQGATGSGVPSGATYQGGNVVTSWPTAGSNANMVGKAMDKMGRDVTILDCPLDLQISTTVTLTASTSETLLLSSGTTGVYNDLVSAVVSNSGSTAALVTFRNTGYGTTGWIHIFVPATDTRGLTTAHVWPQQASASDWTVQGSASSSSIYVDAVFCQRK